MWEMIGQAAMAASDAARASRAATYGGTPQAEQAPLIATRAAAASLARRARTEASWEARAALFKVSNLWIWSFAELPKVTAAAWEVAATSEICR